MEWAAYTDNIIAIRKITRQEIDILNIRRALEESNNDLEKALLILKRRFAPIG